MKDTVVLHLSDLHFGRGFVDGNWTQITQLFRRNPPSLIVVTGDVVNSPTRSSLKEANSKLDEFKAALVEANEGQDIPLIYIPGNHDTRISGLVPLYLLIGLGGILLAASVATAFSTLDSQWSVLLLALGCISLLARLFYTSNLKKVFGSKLVTEPRSYSKLNIGIIPLDSSLVRWFGAYGRVSTDFRTTLRDMLSDEQNKKLFWIAAVHHHPLPIPSNDAWEPKMLLRNAGTLLRNLICHNVPLVLHGHKHHQHFSRIFLADSAHIEREISVLSAGTPTHSKNPKRTHSFNTITVDADNLAQVSVYEADTEGEFRAVRWYSTSSTEVYSKRRWEDYRDFHSVSADRMVIAATIDEFGSAIWAEEFAGLKTAKVIDQFPYNFLFTCPRGHFFSGKSRAKKGPAADVAIRYTDRDTVTAKVTFDPSWQTNCDKFEFRLEYRVLNFCALNSVQFENMYAGDSKYINGVEKIIFDVPDRIAVNEFLIHVKFPHSSALPENIRLFKEVKHANKDEWIELSDDNLIRIHSTSSVSARLLAPTPGASYQIRWAVNEVEDNVSSQGNACQKALQQIDGRWLRDFAAEINACMTLVCAAADESFIKRLDDFEGYTFSVVVFSYDQQTRSLKKSFGSGDNHMRGEGFRFGLGLAGLALKARRLVFYDKNLIKKYEPIRHQGAIAWDDEQFDIEQETEHSVAVPLYCEADTKTDALGNVTFTGRPYGVLKIAFEGLDSHKALFDVSNSFAQAIFAGAVSRIMYDLVKRAVVVNNRGVDNVKCQ
jgi:predicted phosphodiesterase